MSECRRAGVGGATVAYRLQELEHMAVRQVSPRGSGTGWRSGAMLQRLEWQMGSDRMDSDSDGDWPLVKLKTTLSHVVLGIFLRPSAISPYKQVLHYKHFFRKTCLLRRSMCA